jgi:hypothetical protein
MYAVLELIENVGEVGAERTATDKITIPEPPFPPLPLPDPPL